MGGPREGGADGGLVEKGEQFWHVVDWLCKQHVASVPDSLLAEFLLDVDDDDYPASVLARFTLRQLRAWAHDLAKSLARRGDNTGEDAAAEIATAKNLLEGMQNLSSETGRDGEYHGGEKARKGLKVPTATLMYVKSGDLPGTLKAVEAYVAKAEKHLGPSLIEILIKRRDEARSDADATRAPAEEEEAWKEEETRAPPPQRRAAKGVAGKQTRSGKRRKRIAIESSEEEDVKVTGEDQAAIKSLQESRDTMRAKGGLDPLEASLAMASLAKPKKLIAKQQNARTVEWDNRDEGETAGRLKSSPQSPTASRVTPETKTKRRPTNRWNPVEAEYLVEAVNQKGKKWEKILAQGKAAGYFKGRTGVDLKDKFRNLHMQYMKLKEAEEAYE
ncbi:SANT domain-containing protein [Chloropicon primus]|uniref:Myb-like domain-containing protein n=1 Tax=Chloropicon primus TaxID=1764295 RepID=A0A5B8MQ42_9CHLO|nr:hypothetical protein A3770_08p50510 [Chloropicon primus]UPR01754.1 SANT domain-containing protein [Chloropicon primus]|mmetsp:Transcript_8239/g.23535  ORF Transcript_8239/g.23535 Transcript_8239/m.23535 type:complete len:388 (+) Transcript_8239:367-1530(+)|eukprot:QDZ22533.1 hypothetical protein A3770_08p50510 [Chloropicon primus]